MPLFPPPMPLPQVIAPDYTDLNNAALVTLTAGRIYFAPLSLLAQVTLTQMRCLFSGSPTGNCDMGIYDATGSNGVPNNLLGHTGAISAVTGLFTQSLTATLSLGPAKLWIAWMDTVADTIARSTGPGVNGQGPWYVSNNTFSSLPNPLTGGVANTPNKVMCFGLYSGGYS